MSHAHPTASSSSDQASNFQLILINALDKYKKRTKKDLLKHPLVTELQYCNSPSAILAVLQQQLQGLDQSRRNDERWTRWLDPTVNVLYTLSGTLGEGVGLILSPAKVIFVGVGVLLSAAKDARASQDTIINIFERIEMFFRRLETYTQVPPTVEMMDMIIQTMVEVLCILGIATKEIKQGRLKKYAKKLVGRTEMEDALNKLDKLTQEEARMAAAENLKATHAVDERVKGVVDAVEAIDNKIVHVDDLVAGVNERVVDVDNRIAGVDDRVADVNERVADVNDRVADVNDRVAAVDDQVVSVNERVVTVDDRVKVVDSNLIQVIADGKETKASIQQMAEESKRSQLRENTHKWLSPPDPSTNHNIACTTHHKKTAAWFFKGSLYQEWKATGSLLWIHGKPGSGKSIICSTVIQDIEAACKAGNGSMAYFYFDFRNASKQGLRDLLTSLLIQLSACSGPCCDILSDLYLAHDEGKNQPSESSLEKCLKKVVSLPDQPLIHLIIDALDESPNTSGISSPREMVLQLVKELVDLSLPNLHICVTSRPEFDIRDTLEPLASFRVSLHDESGQKEDIEDYVRSVVYSDSQRIMKRWKTEDKELVIKTLSERANGMFRWVFCQLETLRHCLPPSVRCTLDELPESLDETYERVLKEIKKPNRDHARRLLQCLVVAIRPLEVEELAEVLAVDFDDAEEIPKLNPNWRWEDEEQALLTSCSSLIAIVEAEDSRVVQFSHFSVKEYLTSTRLADASKEVSRYHIDLEAAHMILAQACMAVLLHPDDFLGEKFPLAGYAAQHWPIHVRLKSVSLSLKRAMEYLFDLDRPHFATWLELHNIDTMINPPSVGWSSLSSLGSSSRSNASPLYYAALCGLQDLVEHLAIKHPQHVKTNGGRYGTPLIAALVGRHFETAKFLHDNGAHLDVRFDLEHTALHYAARNGDVEMVQVLLGYEADVSARAAYGETALHYAAVNGSRHQSIHNIVQSSSDIARILLDHGADVNARTSNNSTPLHSAVEEGSVEVARILLEHGVNVDVEGKEVMTPLHGAARRGSVELVRMLLDHGADVNARMRDNSTPLHMAVEIGSVEVARMLLEHGANADLESKEVVTPLHGAAGSGSVELVRMLLEHGADVNERAKGGSIMLFMEAESGSMLFMEAESGSTPLLMAAKSGSVEVVRMLIKQGANADVKDDEGGTLLHGAARSGSVELVRMLLEHGADVNAGTKGGSTPLLMAAESGSVEVVQMLMKQGANADVEDEKGETLLHRAARSDLESVELVRVLLEHGADIEARTKGSWSWTPLLMAIVYGRDKVAQMLLEHGADIDARTQDSSTPLLIAVKFHKVELARMLIKQGANADGKNDEGETPLHRAVEADQVEFVCMLLEHGADVNARTKYGSTPLLKAVRRHWNVKIIVQMLIKHGANVNAEDETGRTPLHEAAVNYGKVNRLDLVRMLLKHGADIEARTNDNSTPLLMAATRGHFDVMRMLLKYGANAEAEDEKGRTSFQIASAKGYDDIVELLSDHGAKGVFSVSTSSLCLPW